jgi:hypothetical protein
MGRSNAIDDAINTWHAPSSRETGHRSAGKKFWLDMRKTVQAYRNTPEVRDQIRNIIRWMHYNSAVSDGPRSVTRDSIRSRMRGAGHGGWVSVDRWNNDWSRSWVYSVWDTMQHWYVGLYLDGSDVSDYTSDR